MTPTVGRSRFAPALAAAHANALALLFGTLVASSAGGAASARLARAEQLIRTEMTAQRIPGLAVAVIDRGGTLIARGYGEANVEHHIPVGVATVFQSGSVGKQFTAAAVMLFVEDGRLSLEDPITRFFPEAPESWSAIRVRHLLTHTSGIRDYTNDLLDMRHAYTDDELVSIACAQPLEFPAGERYGYSNTGYLLLGAILRRVGGRHYSEVLSERIFRPLGMRSARLIDESAIVMHRAAGYQLMDGRLVNQQWVSPELNTTADGALYLSLADMVAWDKGLREGRILRPESWREVFTPVALNSGHTYPYGFGWEVSTIGGQKVVSHDGAWQGFETHISRYLGDGLTIVVLSNLAEADPGRIARRLAGIFRDHLAPKPRSPIPDTQPAQRDALEQLLKSARDGTLTATDLPYIRGGFSANILAGWQRRFEDLGDLRTLSLVAREPLGDDEVSEYVAEFANARRLVVHTLDPLGRTVDLEVGDVD
jgi:CubicO group peptidase (beta-lactamase class C family)